MKMYDVLKCEYEAFLCRKYAAWWYSNANVQANKTTSLHFATVSVNECVCVCAYVCISHGWLVGLFVLFIAITHEKIENELSLLFYSFLLHGTTIYFYFFFDRAGLLLTFYFSFAFTGYHTPEERKIEWEREKREKEKKTSSCWTMKCSSSYCLQYIYRILLMWSMFSNDFVSSKTKYVSV